jgi:tRNA threonylcarbamoyladenosine biosynthesis protein TsaB
VLTLALDTTTRAGSVAVITRDRVLSVVHGDPSRTHGERLPGEIDRALREAAVDVRALQLLAVASGPGAFTGLRIGLATMQGMAMVLGTPVVTVSALDALALAARQATQPPPSRVAAWMDAQRGEVFAAYYDVDRHPPAPLITPIAATPDVVLALLPRESAAFIGDGARRYESQILRTTGTRNLHSDAARNFQSDGDSPPKIADPARLVIAHPAELATLIGALGIERALHGQAGPPHALQPLYVRRPDAELERLRQQLPPAPSDSRPAMHPRTSGDKL